jgi:predicted SnoaL-like aldol condensation-catalyzing enzyme
METKKKRSTRTRSLCGIVADGKFVVVCEHWDVIQDEATKEESKESTL